MTDLAWSHDKYEVKVKILETVYKICKAYEE